MTQHVRETLFCNDRLAQRRFAVTGALLMPLNSPGAAAGISGKNHKLDRIPRTASKFNSLLPQLGTAVQLYPHEQLA